MKRALFIAYLFPPHGGPGVQRTLSFTRHLPALGWQPEVITVRDRSSAWVTDEALLKRVPSSVGVHRVAEGPVGPFLRKAIRTVPRAQRSWVDGALFVPDRGVFWGISAFSRAVSVAVGSRAELVYATGAPWTNLLLGRAVSRRLGLPYVADFRDPWTGGSIFRPATPLHGRLHRFLEERVHQAARVVIANTEGNLRDLQARFPLAADKAVVIPNGWDEDDFVDLEANEPEPGLVRVGYAGNFYPGREPGEVLRVFAEARSSSARLRERLRLRFVGHTVAASEAARCGLSSVVEELGYRPLPEALNLLSECHATLVTVPVGARPGWVPQKLYQQLRLGRPIITLAPEGDAAAITRAAGQCWVDPARPDAGRVLARALQAILDGARFPMEPHVVNRYDRRLLAERLAQVFDEAIRPAASP